MIKKRTPSPAATNEATEKDARIAAFASGALPKEPQTAEEPPSEPEPAQTYAPIPRKVRKGGAKPSASLLVRFDGAEDLSYAIAALANETQMSKHWVTLKALRAGLVSLGALPDDNTTE